MVEYISAKEIGAPYDFQINENNGYKIAGLDFTLDNGIRENVTVYEFTFKALQEGTTTITLTNAKLTDSQDYINTIVLGKEITISEKKEVIVEEKEATILETKPNKNQENIIAKEVLTVEQKVETQVNTEIKTTNITKKEVIETKQEEKKEVKEEKTTFIEKAQKVFNELLVTLRNLFR